jgi:hypothetical protein
MLAVHLRDEHVVGTQGLVRQLLVPYGLLVSTVTDGTRVVPVTDPTLIWVIGTGAGQDHVSSARPPLAGATNPVPPASSWPFGGSLAARAGIAPRPLVEGTGTLPAVQSVSPGCELPGPKSSNTEVWSWLVVSRRTAPWLLGQAPRQSHEIYITYVWDNLPPPNGIASGKVGRVPGEAS